MGKQRMIGANVHCNVVNWATGEAASQSEAPSSVPPSSPDFFCGRDKVALTTSALPEHRMRRTKPFWCAKHTELLQKSWTAVDEFGLRYG